MDDFRKGMLLGEAFLKGCVRFVKALIDFFKPWGAKAVDVDTDKEYQALVALYQEMIEAYERSKLGIIEPNMLAAYIAREAIELCGITPTSELLEPFYDAIAKTLQMEGFWYPPPESILATNDAIERAEIQIHLKNLKRIYSDAEGHLDYLATTLKEVLAYILLKVSTPLVEEAKQGERLTVSLLETIDELDNVISIIAQAFYEEHFIEHGLFTELRSRFNHNVMLASGINPEHEHISNKPWIFPDQSRLQGQELIDAYLKQTPFEHIFESALPFSIPERIKPEHTHILAGTGHGKTQLLQKLTVDDIQAGLGFMVIDSQGDLINNIMMLEVFDPHHPNSLADKLIIVDPNDIDYPVALNLFALNDYNQEGLTTRDKEVVFNATVEMYSYLFGALFGAEMTQRQSLIFTYLARLMLEIPDANIHTFRKLLQDGKEYIPYMNKLQGTAKAFFKTEYFSKTFAQTKKQILTRLWGVLSNATLERLFSATENKVNLSQSINEGKIILVNTAKSLLRDNGAQILGRFFIALLSQATLLRTTIPESKRKLWSCYIDECQDYVDEKITTQLEQARKFKVPMILAHQSLSQLPLSVRASIFTNTSTKFAGGVSYQDAAILSKELRVTDKKLLGITKHQHHTEYALFLKNITPEALTVNVPFGVLETLPVMDSFGYQALIERNRENYCYAPSQLDDNEDIVIAAKEERLGHKKEIEQKPESLIERTAKPYIQTKQGKGGSLHTYLQNRVRSIGQKHNYLVELEKPLSGGKSIDAVLTRNNTTIAIEISVTTKATHEANNIQKCFDSGFEQVMILCPDRKHLNSLKKGVSHSYSIEIDSKKLMFLLMEELDNYLSINAPLPEKPPETIAGYRVRTKYLSLSKEDAERRKMAIVTALRRPREGAGSVSKKQS